MPEREAVRIITVLVCIILGGSALAALVAGIEAVLR